MNRHGRRAEAARLRALVASYKPEAARKRLVGRFEHGKQTAEDIQVARLLGPRAFPWLDYNLTDPVSPQASTMPE